jgi:ADP-ribose pyrophosphatase YjhB (NUDIX family)
MHHIQRKILQLLMHAPTLSYARLRPNGVESNHFAYHLDQLIRARLVVKQDRNYSLTPEGLHHADRASHATVAVRKQPHIVTTILINNDAGQTVLFTHAFQPYLGYVGFPQGRAHYDETIAEAASRELFEKTGLQNVPLEHRGMVYVSAVKEGETISKILAHVFTGTVQGTPTLASDDPKKGTASWGKPDPDGETKYMPGFWQITQLVLKSKNLFFAELEDSL